MVKASPLTVPATTPQTHPFVSEKAFIHPDAYVHPSAVIGSNVHIEAGAYIGPYCIIGMPAEWKGRESEDRGVWIRAGARLTGLVTVDSGVERLTVIGSRCYLMKHSHVGHDCQIGADTVISCGTKIGGHTSIREKVNIGLNAVIHQRQAIAEGCMIGMGSVVTRKLVTEPFRKYAGNPAKDIGSNHER